MRVTTAFNKLLGLPDTSVTAVEFTDDGVIVDIRLQRRELVCPQCGWSTLSRHNLQKDPSSWRALDLGVWKVTIRTHLRRLSCPTHGVIVEAVPFARHKARITHDVEQLVAWSATKMDQTAVGQLTRINWRTVGEIIKRVVADELDPQRLDNLYDIGVDEISYKKQHNYLTIVVNHLTGKVVWADEGKDSATLDRFFEELGPDRAKRLAAVSCDMGRAYPKSVAEHAPQATICWDPFHVVALATKALDAVRREHWNAVRKTDSEAARKFKGARWALLKNPEDLTCHQAESLAALKRAGGVTWRAYRLKEALRAIFDGDLVESEAAELLSRWCAWAQRCRIPQFVKLGRSIREHRDGILAAVRLGLSNGRVEGLNNKIRLITRRAFGFHSAKAAAAMVLLCCGPVTVLLPHQKWT